MGKYRYRAYDKNGKLRKGILVAKDEKFFKKREIKGKRIF